MLSFLLSCLEKLRRMNTDIHLLALLRCHGLHLCNRLHLLRRRIRDCKVRRGYLSDGCPPTRFDRQEYATPFKEGMGHELTHIPDIVPVIMAGIIAIYGLVVSVLISAGLSQKEPLFTSFIQLGAGLSVGLAGLAAGFAIGIVGDAGVRGTAQQPRLFVGMILILIFAEVLGLYGLIVALLMNSKASTDVTC